MGDDGLPLDRWANFYLITSAAAATLVGLLFVVITLAAERAQAKETSKIRLYLTPTVVYFGSVLCLAAVLTFPTQSRLSAAVCCSVAGTAGIVYAISTLLGSRGETRFYERRDVIRYVLLPAGAYGLLIAGGAMLIAYATARPHLGGHRHARVHLPRATQLVGDRGRRRILAPFREGF